MATVNLTEGAIAQIASGAPAEPKPVLQVMELKLLQTKHTNQNERFRLILSDGSQLQQAMLGILINHLVKDGNLRAGSIVQLVKYTCTAVQNRMVIIVLDLVVILDGCPIIGNPMPWGLLQSPSTDHPVTNSTNSQSFGTNFFGGSPNLVGASLPNPGTNQFGSGFNSNNYEPVRYGATNAPQSHVKVEASSHVKVESGNGTSPINRSYNEQASCIRVHPVVHSRSNTEYWFTRATTIARLAIRMLPVEQAAPFRTEVEQLMDEWHHAK